MLDDALKRNAESVARLLGLQVTDPASRWCGACANDDGLYFPHSAGAILEACTAALLHPRSKHRGDRELVRRMRLAAAHLERAQTPQGNIHLAITNFNSPPDTAFVVENVATAAALARQAGERELLAMMEPFLRKAGAGMASGGVHTPNHRWVVCGALAQLHALFGEPAYVRRIDQWLAEGIDLDDDGQFTERSTTVYNAVCDRAFVVMAARLKRPELLDPPRRNLRAMLYLLHPGYEVVTEISRRQDQNQRGDMGRYWFPLAYLAAHDRAGEFATIANHFAPRHASLSALMEYPALSEPGPPPAPVPEDYEKIYRGLRLARIRRGLASATLLLGGSSRFFSFRHGGAVVNAVRFASAFFGKAQFVPADGEKRGDSFYFTQQLEADYVQPFDPPRRVTPGDWYAIRAARRRSEVAKLEQSAVVTEIRNGFRLRVQSHGTDGVPVAVEINLREGGHLEGCIPALRTPDTWFITGSEALYHVGAHAVRVGPGRREHNYTEIRGGEARLPGPSVFLTGYTPFDHTITVAGV